MNLALRVDARRESAREADVETAPRAVRKTLGRHGYPEPGR